MSENENSTMQLADTSSGQATTPLKPVVLKYRKMKKDKKKGDDGDSAKGAGKEKYSRGLKDIQRLDGHVVRIAQKATKALSKGVDVYERERTRSAQEKTDGAIEDFIHNTAKAGSAYLKEAADIPIDLAEAVSPVSARKRLRKGLRRASKFIRLWRI